MFLPFPTIYSLSLHDALPISQRVAPAVAVHKADRLVAASKSGGQKLIARPVVELFGVDFMPSGGPYPALLAQHHCDRLGRHQVGFAERLCRRKIGRASCRERGQSEGGGETGTEAQD